jgi:hypothetical protein
MEIISTALVSSSLQEQEFYPNIKWKYYIIIISKCNKMERNGSTKLNMFVYAT